MEIFKPNENMDIKYDVVSSMKGDRGKSQIIYQKTWRKIYKS